MSQQPVLLSTLLICFIKQSLPLFHCSYGKCRTWVRDRLGAKIAGNIEMSVVPLRGPRTPAVSLALSDWSGVGDWSALKCAKASVNCLANYFNTTSIAHVQNTWPTCLSTWCYPDLVLAPLNDESAASHAFSKMFHKNRVSLYFIVLSNI